MSTIVFVSESKPDPKLEYVKRYKAYLSKEEKQSIMKELEAVEDVDDYTITMHVDIEMKKYDK